VMTRQWKLAKRLYLLPGLGVFLLVAGPWYWEMYQLHGSEFIETFLGLHNFVRATVSEHPKDNVFYYYLVLFPVSMLPWTGILFRYMSILRKEPKTSHLVYLTIWPTIIIVFYTLMATKYPTYVFPASFPAALLIGYTLNKMQSGQGRKSWWWLSIPTLMLIGIIGIASKFVPTTANWTLLYTCAILSSAIILWIQIRGNVYHLPKVIGIVTIIMCLLLINNGLVPLSAARSGKSVASLLPSQGANVASYGEYSTSAVFYSGYNIPRLVHEQESQDQSPWSGKYTMPTAEIKVFDAATANNPMSFVLVHDKNKKEFIGESFSENFYQIANDNNRSLYQRRMP